VSPPQALAAKFLLLVDEVKIHLGHLELANVAVGSHARGQLNMIFHKTVFITQDPHQGKRVRKKVNFLQDFPQIPFTNRLYVRNSGRLSESNKKIKGLTVIVNPL
jgi:hypothetical protein